MLRRLLIVSVLLVVAGALFVLWQLWDLQLAGRAFTSEIPGYNMMSDYKKALSIRRWAYRHVDVSADKATLIDFPPNRYPMTLGEILPLVRNDEGGFWCGGVAYTLYRAYKEAGFNAWVYTYGYTSTITHTTTLVEAAGQIYLQDAYFNLTFVDAQNEPITFSEILSNLRNGSVPTLAVDQDYRDVHWEDISTRPGQWTAYHLDESTPCRPRGEKGQICQLQTSLEGFKARDERVLLVEQDLERSGLPANFDYLLLNPLAIYTDETGYVADPEELAKFKGITDTLIADTLGVSPPGS